MPKPVITLIGDRRFKTKLGESFVDPGAESSDDNLVTTNQVDTSEIGIYYVKYQSTNESGTTLSEREVVVYQPGVCGITIGNTRASFRSFIFGVEYQLSSTATVLDESGSFTITLNTTNVPTGTPVAYTITGVVATDINGADLTGEFIINNGSSSLAYSTGNITENKSFVLTLDDHPDEFIEVSILSNPNARFGNESDPPSVDNPDAGSGPNPDPGTGPLDIANIDVFVQVGQIEDVSGGYTGVSWDDIRPDLVVDETSGETTINLIQIAEIDMNVNMKYASDSNETGSYTLDELISGPLYIYDINNIELIVGMQGSTTSVNTYDVWDTEEHGEGRVPENYVLDTYWDLELTGADDPFTQTILPEINTILNALP